MDVAVVAVPHHLGHFSVGMGAGPDRLLDASLAEALRKRGARPRASGPEQVTA